MAGVWNTFYERLEEAEICATVEMFGSLVWKVRSHGIQGELATRIQNWHEGRRQGGGRGLFHRKEAGNKGYTAGIDAGSTVFWY